MRVPNFVHHSQIPKLAIFLSLIPSPGLADRIIGNCLWKASGWACPSRIIRMAGSTTQPKDSPWVIRLFVLMRS